MERFQIMHTCRNILFSYAILMSLVWVRPLDADMLTFGDPDSWKRTWVLKPGITVFDDSGNLGLVKFRKNINATQDAHLFSHPSNERGYVAGGIWSVLSNEPDASLLIDGDIATYWKPNNDDSLDQWIVQVDLGRAVLAKEIRLHFPDAEGARPFRQFSVFTATGAHVSAKEDVFRFNPVYRTTKPNDASLIRFGFRPAEEDTAKVLEVLTDDRRELAVSSGLTDQDVQGFVGDEEVVALNSQWQMVQFVRFIVDEKQADGALAEIEVISVGDNVSLGSDTRGGSYINGSRATDPLYWLDGNLNTYGVVEVHQQFTESRGTAYEGGLWWQVDLGVTYWVDDAFMYWQKAGERLATFQLGTNNAGTGYTFFSSDGTRTLSGDTDFTEWIFEPEWTNIREQYKRHYRYLFNARKVRHIFWLALKDLGWRAHPMEFHMYSPGYPAEVVLRSDFINLGRLAGDGQPKVIKAVHWDADLPPGARIELRTRSGNEQGEEYTFRNKIGEVVTEEKWNSSPKVLRGPIDTTVVVGEDWSQWSNEYKFSGESFKSDSPRRYVQLELIMATEDYKVAPLVRSVSLEYVDALVNGAKGSIQPRSAKPNEDTRFTYTLWPDMRDGNSGFDQLRFVVPDLVNVGHLAISVAGHPVEPLAVEVEADSLLVTLPGAVLGDSISIDFTTRLVQNASVIDLDLGSSAFPGLWQDVEPAARRSNIVLLPDLMNSELLIDDLRFSNRIFTPNGDGINDELTLSFVLLKADGVEPLIQVLDMSGRVVTRLRGELTGPSRHFVWDGHDAANRLVAPGIYLYQIDANTEAGESSQIYTVSVAY